MSADFNTYLLLKGKNGEAYNVVGEKTNMTILESAKWLADEFGEGKTDVIIDIPKENAGFAPDGCTKIGNSSKIAKLPIGLLKK